MGLGFMILQILNVREIRQRGLSFGGACCRSLYVETWGAQTLIIMEQACLITGIEVFSGAYSSV